MDRSSPRQANRVFFIAWGRRGRGRGRYHVSVAEVMQVVLNGQMLSSILHKNTTMEGEDGGRGRVNVYSRFPCLSCWIIDSRVCKDAEQTILAGGNGDPGEGQQGVACRMFTKREPRWTDLEGSLCCS